MKRGEGRNLYPPCPSELLSCLLFLSSNHMDSTWHSQMVKVAKGPLPGPKAFE